MSYDDFDDFDPELLEALTSGLNPYKRYQTDPVGFCRDVLHVTLWSKQAEAFELLVKHRRLILRSANGIGKTLLAACVAEWFHLCWPVGECLITGPRQEQLRKTTFKEIRKLHGSRPGASPKATHIETSPDHYISATTATSGTAFKGIHSNLCIVFEEATEIADTFYVAAKEMLVGGDDTFFFIIFNPTDTSSSVFLEEASGQYEVMSVSAFDHPNIVSQLNGGPIIIPHAVNLDGLKKNMDQWGEWITEDKAVPSDIRFEEAGQPIKWWHPGPIGESCILGRYPSQSSYSIFAESDFVVAQSKRDEADAMLAKLLEDAKDTSHPRAGQPDRHGSNFVITFGNDCARYGDDKTEIWGRVGNLVFLHDSYNGQNTEWTANRLKMHCNDWGNRLGITPTKIKCQTDDTGVGGGVTDQNGDYYFAPVNSSSIAAEDHKYPNKRSELLFNLAEMMRSGEVLFTSNIDKQAIQELQRQALSVTYKADSRGRRVAESKDDIKKRLKGRSPDSLDGLALAFAYGGGYTEHKPINVPKTPIIKDPDRPMLGSR